MKKEDKKRDPMPPPEATPEEIGEFWDTHDLADYWDETQEVEVQVDLKSEQNQTKPNLPTTIEDEANIGLDIVTDLALDATIPAPIRRNALKAFDRLCSALIDVPIGALERRSFEKRAESEARIKITEAVNAQIVQQIKVDSEFPQRASNTFAKKILREQYNLEKILGFATDILKRKKYDDSTNQQVDSESEKSISEDWFNIFEKEGSQKSTEEVQHRFARVLAGEIEKPGSYSPRTLKTLGELDQNIAALFKKLCSVCIVLNNPVDDTLIDIRIPSLGGDPGRNVLKKYGLPFSKLNTLNEYGLIISDHNSGVDYQVSIVDENHRVLAPFRHQGQYWALLSSLEREQDEEFRIWGVALSRVGRELFQIVQQELIPEYTEDLKKYFAKQQLKMVAVPRSGPSIVKPTITDTKSAARLGNIASGKTSD